MNAVADHFIGSDAQKARAAATPTEVDKHRLLRLAEELLTPPDARDSVAYPVDALGPLADVCKDVAQHGQLPPAMAGQCLLTAAALLVQEHYNVKSLTGVIPTSLYALTEAYSGEGKTTAERVALAPIYEQQRHEAQIYSEQVKQAQSSDDGKLPPSPFRISKDATIEGLRRDFERGRGSQGMFNSEAAMVLTGYGMTPEQRYKTTGCWNSLYDDGHLSVSRAGQPRFERFGLRFSMHLLIQPDVAGGVLKDRSLSAIGFWPRVLLARPPAAEPRKAIPFHPEKLQSVGAFWGRCNELLNDERHIPEDADPNDHSDNAVLVPEPQALEVMNRAFERFEQEGKRGSLRCIRPFAVRASEQASRVAGVLAGFAGHTCITKTDAQNALLIVAYSLEAWRTVFDEAEESQDGRASLALFRWLLDRPLMAAERTTILQSGPRCIRSKDRLDAALELLAAHRLVFVAGKATVVNEDARRSW